MATLALKKAPSALPNGIRKDKRKAIDFKGHKSGAVVLRTSRQRPEAAPKFEEVFGYFKPHLRSVGENMLIIRAWMHKKGFSEIPEHFTITEFASRLELYIKAGKRWAIQHFYKDQEAAARRFIEAIANAVLTEVSSARP